MRAPLAILSAGVTATLVVSMALTGLLASSGVAAAAVPSATPVTVTVVSDTNLDVVELNRKAVATPPAPAWPVIPGATTVWTVSAITSRADFGPFTFHTSVAIPARVTNLAGTITVGGDNAWELYVNGLFVGSNGVMSQSPSACLTDALEWRVTKTLSLNAFLRADASNTIDVKGVNYWETVADPACTTPPVVFGLPQNAAMVEFRADLGYELPVDVSVGVRVLQPIQLGGHDGAQVAVLSSAPFDATTVDPKTVCFGSASIPASRNCVAAGWRLWDVDRDGRLDLVLEFDADRTGILATDTTACLTGTTFGGTKVTGCAPIRFQSTPFAAY